MPGRIPQTLRSPAQRLLPAAVLATLEEQPKARLPTELWDGLNDDQRKLVGQIRKLATDGFDPAPAAPNPGVPTPFAGTDPIGRQGAIDAAPNPNPRTGLDPQSLQELFGAVVDTAGLDNFEGEALLTELRRRFFSAHVTLDYDLARQELFTNIDNDGGRVVDVYTGRVADNITEIPDADTGAKLNTEHTWPQSQLKKAGKSAAISDLHHLEISDTHANSVRGSLPFGVVTREAWAKGGSQVGTDSTGKRVFTPPVEHRGNIARAMFWIATAYELDIPPDEEAVLRAWNDADPVDARERRRNTLIAAKQGDLNPFVIDPTLSDRVSDF